MNSEAHAKLTDIIDWHVTRNEYHPHIGVHQTIMLLEYLTGEKPGFEAYHLTKSSEYIDGRPPLAPLLDALELNYAIYTYEETYNPEYRDIRIGISPMTGRYEVIPDGEQEVMVEYAVGDTEILEELRQHGGFEYASKELIGRFIGVPEDQIMNDEELNKDNFQRREEIYHELIQQGEISPHDRALSQLLSYVPHPTRDDCLSHIEHAKHMNTRLREFAREHDLDGVPAMIDRQVSAHRNDEIIADYRLEGERIDHIRYLIDRFDGDNGGWSSTEDRQPICPCGTTIPRHGTCPNDHVSPLLQLGIPEPRSS
jgi:hypothetical protein